MREEIFFFREKRGKSLLTKKRGNIVESGKIVYLERDWNFCYRKKMETEMKQNKKR